MSAYSHWAYMPLVQWCSTIQGPLNRCPFGPNIACGRWYSFTCGFLIAFIYSFKTTSPPISSYVTWVRILWETIPLCKQLTEVHIRVKNVIFFWQTRTLLFCPMFPLSKGYCILFGTANYNSEMCLPECICVLRWLYLDHYFVKLLWDILSITEYMKYDINRVMWKHVLGTNLQLFPTSSKAMTVSLLIV